MAGLFLAGVVVATAVALNGESPRRPQQGTLGSSSLDSVVLSDWSTDHMGLTNYSWLFLRSLMSYLDSLLYPEESALSVRAWDEPINPQEILAEADVIGFLAHVDINGIPTGLGETERDEADSLTLDILSLLDSEPGIISTSLDQGLRAAIAEIRGELLMGARHAGSI